MSVLATIGQVSSYIALAFGILFFTFATKYYFAILLALFGGRNNSRKIAGNRRGKASRQGNPDGGVEAPGQDELRGLFKDLPVHYITRTVIFGAYDNIIDRWPALGKSLRTVLQALERTPLRIFGLSHYWVVEKE